MKQNTLLESTIERRNFYQGRMIENMVNVIYFTRQLNEAKPDTQDRVDAKNQIEQAEKSIHNDEKLMFAFDILINELSKPQVEVKPEQPKVTKQVSKKGSK